MNYLLIRFGMTLLIPTLLIAAAFGQDANVRENSSWRGKYYDELVERYGFGERHPVRYLSSVDFDVMVHEHKNVKFLVATDLYKIKILNVTIEGRAEPSSESVENMLPYELPKQRFSDMDGVAALREWIGRPLVQFEYHWGRCKPISEKGLHRIKIKGVDFLVDVDDSRIKQAVQLGKNGPRWIQENDPEKTTGTGEREGVETEGKGQAKENGQRPLMEMMNKIKVSEQSKGDAADGQRK